MIERGTAGRTSALTDWQLMDVTTMWACLQDHDTTNHWKQVAGWRKVCDLAREHLSRLQQYRHGLATAWPPETNDAARTYIHELDQLINKVQRTHDAASTNYTTLSAATQAISTTRTELKKIHDAYTTKLQEKQTYDATLNDPKAAIGSRVPDRPITNADLEQLNIQARGIMYGLSGELQQAQTMLQKPPLGPNPSPGVDQGSPDIYGGARASAPAIPPIIPVSLANTSPDLRQTRVSRQASTSAAAEVGPTLGGAGIGVMPPPANSLLPGVTSPSTPAGSGIGPMPTPSIGLRPEHTKPGIGRDQHGVNRRAANESAGKSPHGVPPASARTMAPGGLIGGAPGMGIGQPGNTGAQQRRANPIGGVIGGGAGTGPTGSAGSRPGSGRSINPMHSIPPVGGNLGTNTTRAAGTGGFRGSQGGNEEEARRWNPDHPWKVDQGVNPIVRPPDNDGPIDPGPAIGFDR